MSEEKNTYVVLRLSSLSQTYPNDEFVVMSLKPLADLFYGLKNVRFVEVAPELEHSHKLCSLAKQIKALNPVKVFDLQNDFRTRVVRYVLHFYAIPTCTIDLGTRERRALSRAGFEKSTPLKPEVERYADTFRSGGLIPAGEVSLMKVNTQAAEKVQALFGKKTERWIGIAPFAKHLSNVLPYKTMKDVIGYYAQQPNTRIFLFGAGHVETEMLRQWAEYLVRNTYVYGFCRMGKSQHADPVASRELPPVLYPRNGAVQVSQFCLQSNLARTDNRAIQQIAYN